MAGPGFKREPDDGGAPEAGADTSGVENLERADGATFGGRGVPAARGDEVRWLGPGNVDLEAVFREVAE